MRVTREVGGYTDLVFMFIITYHNARFYSFENINKIVCIFQQLVNSCPYVKSLWTFVALLWAHFIPLYSLA